uniref:nucleotidyltransferase family protein n=1 Tax=Enterocloster aldenensis TaxID=358742 RepID=UPI0022E02AD0
MRVEYIVIQAGGKGTRLGNLTKNKPKGIVPFKNLPIIFHLFNKYPQKKFIIISDYKYEVLDKYLESFAKVKFLTVKAEGVGTCAGICKALKYIPDEHPFMLIWSDLILGTDTDIDTLDEGNYIGISKNFECRWSYKEDEFVEQHSYEHGVAGLFVFKNKSEIKDVPYQGELVRWMGEKAKIFKEIGLYGTREVGTLIALEQSGTDEYRCRPFNSMEVDGDILIKRPIDEQGRKLAVRETKWYQEVQKYEFSQIPKIFKYEPLTMEKIKGENIFKTNLTIEEKRIVVDNLVHSLEKLHSLKRTSADVFSIMEAYYHKTIKRLESVRDLIPFADQEYIRINKKNCRNPYFYKDEFRRKVKDLLCDVNKFALIHGDCTFSNTMVDSDLNIVFLDPRGYFGFQELYGDEYYDWAKVYYSIEGDYDQFNNKKFDLTLTDNEVLLEIETNGWKDVGEYFISRISGCNPEKIKFLHAIIWLSLTTYAWEDYDSICGAFYKGTYLLEDVL